MLGAVRKCVVVAQTSLQEVRRNIVRTATVVGSCQFTDTKYNGTKFSFTINGCGRAVYQRKSYRPRSHSRWIFKAAKLPEGHMLQILAMCSIFPDKRNAILKCLTLYGNPLTLSVYRITFDCWNPYTNKRKEDLYNNFFFLSSFRNSLYCTDVVIPRSPQCR